MSGSDAAADESALATGDTDMTRTMWDMPNPFTPGTEVVCQTSGAGYHGRTGTVTAEHKQGMIVVLLDGDPYGLRWHWSHFAGVDALTGETVDVQTSLPRVPCPDCVGYPCECGMAGGF